MAYSNASIGSLITPADPGPSREHAPAARSLALRARGLRCTSSSLGTIGFFVSTFTAASSLRSSARSVCFTIRSSSEWNAITTSRAPDAQPAGGRLEKAIEPFELAVHPDAQRLERARRRIDAHVAAARNGAPHDRRQPAGGLDRRLAPRLDDRPRDPAREALLAVLEDRVGQLALRSSAATRSAAVSPPLRSIRMSSGSSRWKLKPRPGASNCSDDTPRSASAPSTTGDAAAIEHVVERADSRRARARPDRPTAPASRARGASASRSRSRPMSARRAGLEQRAGVAAEADGAIDEHAAALGLQVLQSLRPSGPGRAPIKCRTPTARARRRRCTARAAAW